MEKCTFIEANKLQVLTKRPENVSSSATSKKPKAKGEEIQSPPTFLQSEKLQ